MVSVDMTRLILTSDLNTDDLTETTGARSNISYHLQHSGICLILQLLIVSQFPFNSTSSIMIHIFGKNSVACIIQR